MKQVFLQHGRLVLLEVASPVCQAGNLLIANHCSLISSGTESSSIRQSGAGLWSKIWQQPQLIHQGISSLRNAGFGATLKLMQEDRQKLQSMGYCSAGVVLEVGRNVAGYQAGDRVACGGYGWASHAQIISVPEKLTVKLPPEVDFRQGAFTTMGSIALHAVHESKAGLGEWVAVQGLGLVGLLAAQILTAAGCQVIGIDPDPQRLDLAQKLGLEFCFTPGDGQAVTRRVLELTQGQGVDAALICAATASSEPLKLAAALTRRRGRITAVGTVGMDVPRDVFYYKELQLSVSCSYGPGRYDTQYEQAGRDYPLPYVRWTENRNMADFVRLMARGQVKVEPLISLESPFEQAAETYRRVMEDQPRPLAALLQYPPDPQVGPAKVPVQPPVAPRPKDVLNLALIGCGGIAKGVHLPILSGLKNFRLAAVASRTVIEAKACAEKYRAGYYATDYAQILADKDIDLVFICTRNNLHAAQTIQAAQSGKHILVEKPLALTYADCERAAAAAAEAGVFFTVGFNRHYAPLVQQALQLLGQKSGPVLVNYRINAESLPRDHWTLDMIQGGGRILGEACHFVELCNYLCGSRPVSFSAKAVPVDGQTVYALENVAASIGYENGSLATITYTSLGHPDLPKERLEIYRGNGVLVLDNFISLQAHGFGAQKEWKLSAADKGYTRQLQEFYKRINGQAGICITPEEALSASYCTFKLWDCLAGSHLSDPEPEHTT